MESDRVGTVERGYVLLGDVVGSREIEDRRRFRGQLATAKSTIETTYGADLLAGPTALKGIDELGAVLTSLDRLYEIVLTLYERLYPHEIRLAVAGGEIEFGQDRTDVTRMDGEAFHRANDLLESVDRENLRFDLETGRGPVDTAIADEINLLLHRRASWTDRQREVVSQYERAGTQESVAAEFGVTQQAVSNVLQGADWPLVETIERRLRRTLRTLDSDVPVDEIPRDETEPPSDDSAPPTGDPAPSGDETEPPDGHGGPPPDAGSGPPDGTEGRNDGSDPPHGRSGSDDHDRRGRGP